MKPVTPYKVQPNLNPHAFTLIETVIVVAVIAILSGIWMVSTFKNSRILKRAQCAANLQQFAQATHLYATENRERLPEMTSGGGGAWAWDMPIHITSAMQGFGMESRSFYCPGTAPRFNDHLNFLNTSINSLWSWGEIAPGTGFRIIGYLTAYNGSALAINVTNQNKTIQPERPQATVSVDQPPQPNGERVLLADATISENKAGTGAAPAAAGSFTFVSGGFAVAHISPHVNGNLPAGGNLAFKDGHVAWREFKDMSQRATGSSRGFWW